MFVNRDITVHAEIQNDCPLGASRHIDVCNIISCSVLFFCNPKICSSLQTKPQNWFYAVFLYDVNSRILHTYRKI